MAVARPHPDQLLIRRDAQGEARNAPDWETLVERLIREAQQAGAFDDLPDQGRPLQLDDDGYAGDMAVANHIMRTAGIAPPWIETDKEVRRLLARLESFVEGARHERGPLEQLYAALDQLADEHDAAVNRLNSTAPTHRQHRRRLDRTAARARLESMRPDPRCR